MQIIEIAEYSLRTTVEEKSDTCHLYVTLNDLYRHDVMFGIFTARCDVERRQKKKQKLINYKNIL